MIQLDIGAGNKHLCVGGGIEAWKDDIKTNPKGRGQAPAEQGRDRMIHSSLSGCGTLGVRAHRGYEKWTHKQGLRGRGCV